jgi:hypothetical protein
MSRGMLWFQMDALPDGIDANANSDMCQMDACFEQDRDDQRTAVDPVWCVHHLQLKRKLLAVDLGYLF